jgi:hypothetical protein
MIGEIKRFKTGQNLVQTLEITLFVKKSSSFKENLEIRIQYFMLMSKKIRFMENFMQFNNEVVM